MYKDKTIEGWAEYTEAVQKVWDIFFWETNHTQWCPLVGRFRGQ